MCWRSFDDPQMDHLVKLALNGSPLTAALDGVIFDGGQLAANRDQQQAVLRERWVI